MKLIKTDGDQVVFQMSKRETRMLVEVLKLYPVVPAKYQPLSKAAPEAPRAENQRLLEEALAEHRRENRRQLEALLNEPNRCQENEHGFLFSFSPAQMEWLLQILNDVRVGSWLLLGCPDEKRGQRFKLNEKNSRYLFAMELGGHFQSALLEALDQRA